MSSENRRVFLRRSGAAALAAGALTASGHAATPRPWPLGVIVNVGPDPAADLARVQALGLPTCQLELDDFQPAVLARLAAALPASGLRCTALGTAGPGPSVYNFYDGPLTLGLVPGTFRAQRIERIQRLSDFARRVGVATVRIHVGFIPEDPNRALYPEVIEVLRQVVGYCRQNGQRFLYETGTETPVTLLRAIEDVGLDNQGVNLDTGNFILYDTANPVDALDVIGRYVENLHAKDGLYPTGPRALGEEVRIPRGKVDFPRFFARLRALGYHGPVTIERETAGSRWFTEVAAERDYLRRLLATHR
ncbi:MAG: sugar phosphate isomerase/epimerase family protein [Terriglobales bacterium]